MRFDSNQAWTQAVASVGANRDVIWPLAGVFFLLPGLAMVWFFSGDQAALMAAMSNPATASAAISAIMGKILPFVLLAMLFKTVGNMSVLALLTDRNRPTVGEAIGSALRSLPTIIGASLLLFLGYVVIGVAAVMVIALIIAAIKVAAIAVVLAVVLLVALFWALTRLSMLLPVIVIDKVTNPITAITRAWGLTKGNAGGLFLFYFLLFVAYVVIALVVQLALGAMLGISLMGAGAAVSAGGVSVASLIIMGLVSGIIGMIVAVLLNAVLAAVHHQLAGPSADAYSDTFA